jgi:hypothetical protein
MPWVRDRDYRGDSLVGCVACNVWRGDQLTIKLSDEDLMALKEINRQVIEIAQCYLAKQGVESTQAYVARGRRFQVLSDEQLQQRYVQIIRQWASAPTEPVSRGLAEDVHSEYELRNLLPPSNLVVPQLKSIGVAVARLCDELTEDRKDEIGAEIFEEHERAQHDRH